MQASTRKALIVAAPFILFTVGYPILVDQGWFRYNSYVLPSVVLFALLVYIILGLDTGSFRKRFRSFVERAPLLVSTSLSVLLSCVLLFGLIQTFLVALGISKNHIAILLNQEVPTPTPTPLPSSSPPAPAVPLTLETLFNTDFPNLVKYKLPGDTKFEDGQQINVQAQEYADFAGRSKFVGFYVPESPLAFRVCVRLGNSVPRTLNEIESRVAMSASLDAGETMTSLKQLVFSGRVFIYHEAMLTLKQKSALVDYYKQANLDVQFRGLAYLQSELMARKLRENKLKEVTPSRVPILVPEPSLPNKLEPAAQAQIQKHPKRNSDNIQTDAITTGPCSNVQIGGTNNTAATNCEFTPPVRKIKPKDAEIEDRRYEHARQEREDKAIENFRKWNPTTECWLM
jgi:hypothetical protein